MVECSICKKEFSPLFEGSSNQASRCAAQIFRKDESMYILGYYGSYSSDGTIYKILTPDYKPGIICDACIEEANKAGHLTVVSENNFFGNEDFA